MLVRGTIAVMALCGGLQAQQPPVPAEQPPLPPSPVEHFRQWLELPPGEREQHLAGWPEPNRSVLRRKIQAYEQLPSGERERRLAMLDLRHYLGALLTQRTPERDKQLQLVPEKYRELVQHRLRQWDELPPELQEKMIENEFLLQYWARYRAQKPLPGEAPDPRVHPELLAKIQAWQAIPVAERSRLSQRLHEFFQLRGEERKKTLQSLSERERREIQRSLETLNSLPPEQRQRCIQSFSKLASMSPEEQIVFLRNAARWQAMTPDERESWKALVNNLPQLPPPFPEEPPLPPTGPGEQVRAVTNATN